MNKKTRSTKSEKWPHACSSLEIAWTNEQKVAVTSYGRNKNLDNKKNQEKADNKPSYRCAAIKKTEPYKSWARIQRTEKLKLSPKLSEKKHLIANKVHDPTETKRNIRAEKTFTKKIAVHSFCSFHVEIIQTLLYIPKSLNT